MIISKGTIEENWEIKTQMKILTDLQAYSEKYTCMPKLNV